MENETSRQETFRVNGEDLIKKIKEIIKEGNIRKIVIKNKEDKIIFEIPVTIGVVGILLAPTFAAIGAVAAIVGECTILVVRDEEVK